jgi:two-component system, cell cycle sensor histidine kinase and response regulator CckA
MSIRSSLSLEKEDLLWILLSLAVLLPSLYYSNVKPVDFTLNPADWQVLDAPPCDTRSMPASAGGPAGGADCLAPGDQVLSIGGLDFETFTRDRAIELRAAWSRGTALLRVRRHGRILAFQRPAATGLPQARWKPPVVFIPLVFWLMGSIAVIFLRPRDERWLVLVAFSYVTTLWLSSGLASWTHARGSAIVFHVIVWLFMPLSVHLHLILPSSLLGGRARRTLLTALYGGAIVLAILDSFYLIKALSALSKLVAVAGVALSLGLLLLRLVLPLDPAVKLANRIMLFGLALGLGPFLLFFGVLPLLQRYLAGLLPDLWVLYPWVVVSSLLSLPLLPMSYIYAIYKHHLGALEFRANRLFGFYSFSALSITAYVVVLFLVSGRFAPVDERFLAAVFTVSLLFALGTPLLREPFQRLIDRHVFGVRHAPDEIIDLVAARVPGAFDRDVLARLLVDEILPALLIRQSALYLFAAAGHDTLYEQGIPAAEPPADDDELRALLARAGRYLPPQAARAPRSWVRLTIPLALQSETLGVWLIGRRDPDDYFPAADIRLLSTVANQVAPMVENIRLYERAQREIAQRIVAEDEIRRSEARFRNLFEATLEGIALVKGGVILEVNHALLAIFGYEGAELIGRDISDLLPEADAALTGIGMPREGTGWKRDGSMVDVEIAAKNYVFQGEDVTVVALRDIARRKRDEAENQMLQRQLLNAQKMEALGRLSAGVAHDFNNCLLAIFGYSDLLLESHAENAFLQRNLAGIKDAAQKAAALTRQLLAFARRQPMESQVVEINALVRGVEKMLRRLLGDEVVLTTDLHPAAGRVKIDPGKLDQVVVNLAVNARHAMPAGGQLTIRTAPLEVKSGAAAPHDLPEGSYVLLAVTDTGTGMDAETQARAFEPFFSTKEEGTGLGLATAYGIVRQSGGHITVESAPDTGSCFTIYLPATQERSESGQPETASDALDSGSEAILLVEDEAAVRSVLQRILTNRGYHVLTATGADEALALVRGARGRRERIDLLLTDVTMPRIKGPELAQALLAEQPGMRVIYMSGYSSGPLPAGDGAPLCLQKPFSAKALARAVRAALDTPPL